MANVQSNPISEYDFTEFPEEITPEQELEIQVNKTWNQKFV